METTCSQQLLDVAGADNNKTLPSAQLISAEQLWQHAELTRVHSSDIWRLGLAFHWATLRQVYRLAPSTSVLLPETVCRVGLHKLSDHKQSPTWTMVLFSLISSKLFVLAHCHFIGFTHSTF